MAIEELKNSTTGVETDTTSIVAQILSDILDASTLQSQPSTLTNSYNHVPEIPNSNSFPQPTCSYQQQEGDSANITHTATKNNDLDEKKSCETTQTVPYQTCTVKEMLSEILDCTVIRRPSLQLPSTSSVNERILPGCTSPPPDYVLDPRLIQSPIYNINRGSNESRKQCTVKEVLSEIMDYTVCTKVNNRQANFCDISRPGTSRSISEQFETMRGYEIYRTHGAGIVNSTSAIHDEAYIQRTPIVPNKKILPSYSTVIRMGPLPKIHSSCSFVPRKPPPSYAEVEGIWEDSPSLISSESAVFGPDPTYMICPRCRIAVITDVQVHRSIVTHLIALFLCLCLCWPCCLMPYCLRTCNYSHHTCPHCSYYFGMYRPF